VQGLSPVCPASHAGYSIKVDSDSINEMGGFMMKRSVEMLIVAALVGGGGGLAFAADPMKEKEATPTIGERMTKDAIKGTLMKMEGEYYSIKNTDGELVKVHVDKSTKLDKVVDGDMVKAYVTDKGHVTTLQRVEK
jgi:hypothetical protein